MGAKQLGLMQQQQPHCCSSNTYLPELCLEKTLRLLHFRIIVHNRNSVQEDEIQLTLFSTTKIPSVADPTVIR